jgi:hypothetical protein
MSAVSQHHGERDRGEQVDKWEVPAVQHDRLHVRVAIALRDRAEVLDVPLLARERLHHAHAGDVFRERRGDEAEALADFAVGTRRADAEDHGRDGHQRNDRQGREGEPPVQDEEQDRRADERERVLHEARHAVGDELVERLDVVRQAADDHPGAVALVVAE